MLFLYGVIARMKRPKILSFGKDNTCDSLSEAMKIVFSIVLTLFISFQLHAQTSPPPLHESEEEEPIDLAPEKEAPKKKAAPPQKTEPAPESAPKATEPAEEKVEVAPEKPIELPSPKPPTPAAPLPPPEPPAVEPPKPEIKVPSNVPVVPVEPIAPETSVAAPGAADGGPMKDAGSDLTAAFPITYALYPENSLSPADTLDVYKLFGRAKEGIGVILIPAQPSSQLVCEILNEQGELLSETKAMSPGETLSFQTSPLEQNSVLYFRVKDLSLLPDSPPAETRKYSLELKPIQPLSIQPLSAAPEHAQPGQAQPGQAPTDQGVSEQPEPEQKSEAPEAGKKPKGEGAMEIDWMLYGLIGTGVLAVLLIAMILLRKLSRKKNPPAA